jgi:pimeloyl-ACP methyl ester carboxylesterase
MTRAAANAIEIEYDTFGGASDPPILLVMGFSAQMIAWDPRFCGLLADHGFFVIRFDNRDVGFSTKLDGAPASDVPYSLSDMSDDGFGLLTALGIDQAHVVGASMGGMIVQTMAIEHPERVLSMTSIMSTTSEPDYFKSDPEAMQALMTPPPTEREAYIDNSVRISRIVSSPRYFDEKFARERATAAFDRCFYPEGATRQMAAVNASGSRETGLRALTVPSLVIHGRRDPLVLLPGGERTAELIPGANLLVLSDMGHDLPRPLWPLITDAIASHARVAATAG